ncbi:MAG: aminotransferase class IV family protein [Myxococcales bacterium]|nr:aminotransferase class IV family protein [Myxococcales bacterium]
MGEAVLVDGVEIEPERATISLRDRSVLHGDSVFEVLRVYGGRVFALEEHLGRLQQSSRIVGRVFPCSVGKLAEEVHRALRASQLTEAHVRVLLTRGVGGDGLSREGVRGASRVVWVRPITPIAPAVYESGLRVCTIECGFEGLAAELCRAKTSNYMPRVVALARAREAGFDDAMLRDRDGLVWEATASNVFAVINGELFTPPLSGPVLAGITRRAVIDLARELSIVVREDVLTESRVHSADELFLSSTIRQLAPVVVVDEHEVGSGVPGPITTRLLAAFRRLAGDR